MPMIRYTLAPRGVYVNNDQPSSPEGSLLRARNVASLAGSGYVRSAPPTVTIASGAAGTNPLTLRALTRFNGRFILRGRQTTERIRRESASGSNSWADLTLPTTPTVTLRTADTPMLFVTAPPTPEKDEHLFLLDTPNTAGDNALLKLNDAGTLTHWGIREMTAAEFSAAAISGAVLAQDEKYIHSAASDPLENAADWTLATADETALSVDTAITTSANPAIEGNSIKFAVGRDDVAQITRAYGANIDLTTFGAKASSDEDFIQVWVRVRRPKHIQSLEIAFDTTAAGDFKRDFFSREVTFKLVGRKQRKRLIGMGDLVRTRDVAAFLQDQSKTNDLTFSEEMGRQKIPVSKNTWSRITLPKNTFDQSGTPNWATVRAIRFTVHANKEGKTAIFLDRLTLNGGAGMHGDYEYTFTFSNEDGTATSPGSRSNPPIDDDTGTVSGLRNALLTVKVPNVERQGVRLTFTNALTFDPQVKRLEIWRTLGNGKAFFRAGYITITVAGTLGAGTTFDDTAADYYGLNSNAASVTAGNNTSFAVLDPTEELPLDNTSPNHPDFAFQDVADRPHIGRMWWARNVKTLGTQGLVYYSPAGRLESVQGFLYVTSGVTDPVQKLVVWNDRLFAFTNSGLYEIMGTDEPFVAQKIEGAPGTTFPYTVVPTAIGIMYVSQDGVYKFNGQYAENITDPSLMPVFRHRLTTGELTIVTINAAMRAVAGRNTFYMGPDFTNFTMAYDFDSGTWRYLDAIAGVSNNSGATYYDHLTGRVIADSIAGGADISEIEPQAYPTSGTITTLTVEFQPHFRAGPGKQAILRKLWVDVIRGTNGASTSFTPTLIIDGVTTALSTFNPIGNDTRTIAEYNLNTPGEVIGVRLGGVGVRDVKINEIKMDIYVPEITDEAV